MELQAGRELLTRVPKGADLWEWLAEYAQRHEIRCARLTGIGAVRKAAWAVYDQEAKEYRETHLDQPLEVVSLVGNYSLLDGEPFPHVHILYSGHDGICRGGHLVAGAEVFLIELSVRELRGDPHIRTLDEELGLPVWEPEHLI